jgi:dTMP kinase
METPGAEADNAETAAVFITFEGIEAAGKSTLIEALADDLRRTGVSVLITREPGGTPLGDAIRRLFIDPATVVDPLAEALLMNASRSQLVADVIGPALRAGRDVLCDRFFDATIAYQGYGRGLDADGLAEVVAWATAGVAADLSVFVDVPVEVAATRRRGSGDADRMERLGPEFAARVRKGFAAQAAAEPGRWLTVDGTRDVEAITANIVDAVRERLGAEPEHGR